MAYNKTNWENSPSTSTPINASNLNKIEEGIYQNSLSIENVSTNIGDLSNLGTDVKTSIVNAINELKEREEYSTTQETQTNKILDGKPIYKAYLEFAHTNANSTYTYTHNLNIDKIVEINAFATIGGQTISSNGYRPMPVINQNSGFQFTIDRIETNSITTSDIGWGMDHVYIWIEYTKTTD